MTSPSPIVEARDVAIGWSRDNPLVEHASFTVERGEIFGILGRSASGKSTMMRTLIGLEDPLEGEIRIMGQPPGAIDGAPPYGVMFQHGALFGSRSLGQNIAFPLEAWTDLPADAISAIARAKLRLVGLEQSHDKLPAELSGGMRKRAAIARALALEPPLLFLDEPSSGLDPITSAEIDRMIQTLARALGLTVIVVTHELGSIESIVDRCILLDRATCSVLAAGAPRRLADSDDPRIRHFFQRVPEAS